MDKNWDKYKACVKAPKLGDEESGIRKLIPKIRKGTLEVSKNFKLGLEFDWADVHQSKVRFSSLAKQADDLFSKLYPEKSDVLNIFIDELELSVANKKQYERDAFLIRDLVIAIENFNLLFKKNNINIGIFAAIRSEVLLAIVTTGKEINKIISDFGSQIVWNQPGVDIDNHPLLGIIIKRINASERNNTFNFETDSQKLWNRYFSPTIQSTSSQRYILHQTWYRPRDIVRLLNLARNQYPEQNKFTHSIFDGIRKEYSVQSWIEIVEELSVKYTTIEIEGIKQSFLGYQNNFSYDEFQKHISRRSKLYPSIDELFKKHKLGELIGDLYKIGVIGNVLDYKNKYGRKDLIRFSFRGDMDVILEGKFKLHNALKGFFTLVGHQN
jgi:hypothetical protein